MKLCRSITCLSAVLLMTGSLVSAQPKKPATPVQTFPPELVKAGESSFVQHCAFCHGRDTGGGEDGPDLTRSKLVADDVNGSQIGPVVRNGRNNMPRFTVTDQELAALAAFIHTRKNIAESQKGGRKGVDAADLATGNVEKGKQYFNGVGKCSQCHSPTGDLAGIATRNNGLKLFQRMLYPRDAKAKMTVTLPSGETVAGTRAYADEFTVALRDSAGRYRSWPAAKVKVQIDDPAQAHVELLDKYTDDDLHNLVSYLLTLK
ncbi:MAG TPA: cytochrome c [Bryobacteraceae bacterium]|jgi:cytochrome c oxidase cbb3-type subunit 3